LSTPQADRISTYLEAKRNAESALETSVTGSMLGLDDSARKPLAEWARREDVVERVRNHLPDAAAMDEAIADSVYAPYLARQRDELAAHSRDRSVSIPLGFDYGRVPGLSNEMRERLAAAGPADLDQAGRVAGVTPAALSALHFALARKAA
jgi:tRNA uridine 5-carboxymethylaminomethyl modification enzyme